MTKPATVPLWAATGPLTTPSGAKTSAGFTPSERAAAQYINFLFHWNGLWQAWLDGLFDGSGNLTLDANAYVKISGTGSYKRGAKVRHVPISAGIQISGTAMARGANHDSIQTSNADNVYRVPITVDEGERITLVTARVTDAGTDVFTMKVWREDLTGVSPAGRVQIGSTANSTGATGALETLSTGAATETVPSTAYSYYAEFTCTYSAGCELFSLAVTTDVP